MHENGGRGVVEDVNKVGCGVLVVATFIWGPWAAGLLFARLTHPRLSVIARDVNVALWGLGVLGIIALVAVTLFFWMVGDLLLGKALK